MNDESDLSLSLFSADWWRQHRSGTLDFSFTLLAQGTGAPLAFAANILIARILGPTDFGVYMTLLSVGLVAGGIGGYGVGPVLTREVAAARDQQHPAMVRVLSRWAMRLTGLISLCAAVVILLWLSTGLGAPPSRWVERVGILGILLSSVWATIVAGLLAGLSRVAKSRVMKNVLKNGLLLAGAGLVLLAGRHRVADVLWLQVASLGFSTVVGVYWLRRAVAGQGHASIPSRVQSAEDVETNEREWGRSAGHFFSMSIATLVLSRLDVVIVNAISGSTQAGLFGAAARLGQVAGIAGLVWVAWLQPRMAHQWQQNHRVGLKRSLRIGVTGSSGMTVFLVGIGWLVAPWLMSLLGGGFENAVWPFRFLLLGYLVWSVSVPFYVLLSMSGRERSVSWILWLQVGITLAVSLPLIFYFGALGGTWAWAGGLAAASIGIIIVEHSSREENLHNDA